MGLEIYAFGGRCYGRLCNDISPFGGEVLCGALFSSESRLLTVLFNTF